MSPGATDTLGERPRSPTGRGRSLKRAAVWVRIPPGAPKVSFSNLDQKDHDRGSLCCGSYGAGSPRRRRWPRLAEGCIGDSWGVVLQADEQLLEEALVGVAADLRAAEPVDLIAAAEQGQGAVQGVLDAAEDCLSRSEDLLSLLKFSGDAFLFLAGKVISPLLCNVYLHRIDRAWDTREHGVLVRFADDALVMCKSREQAEAALVRLRSLLAELGLEPKEAKTRIVHLEVGGAGFDFLGFHHRLVRVTGRRNHRWSVTFLARWPADRAMKHARDRIRELTRRSRLLLRVEVIVDEVNRFLRGWAAYFRYGNSTVRFEKIMHHAWTRIALVIAKRHKRSRAYGWSVLAYQSPDHLGLISLSGTIVAPRPFKDWRKKPNAGGERRR
jgi:hypothetical protein